MWPFYQTGYGCSANRVTSLCKKIIPIYPGLWVLNYNFIFPFLLELKKHVTQEQSIHLLSDILLVLGESEACRIADIPQVTPASNKAPARVIA